MAKFTWQVSGHTVELTHGYWSGDSTLSVDGETVFRRPPPPLYFDLGFAHRFEVEGIPCAVRVVPTLYTFRRELLTGTDAEGVREASSQPIEFPILQVALSVGALGLRFVMFAVACMAILARMID